MTIDLNTPEGRREARLLGLEVPEDPPAAQKGDNAVAPPKRRGKAIPCDGCGQTDPEQRCLGCLHDFGSGPGSTAPVSPPEPVATPPRPRKDYAGKEGDATSAAQRLFTEQCVAHGLPVPVAEYQFHPTRRWRFDYLFDGWLAVEIEGGAFAGGRHTRGAGFRRDLEKYNEAAILEFVVLRFLPEQIASGEAFAVLKRALSAQEGQP